MNGDDLVGKLRNRYGSPSRTSGLCETLTFSPLMSSQSLVKSHSRNVQSSEPFESHQTITSSAQTKIKTISYLLPVQYRHDWRTTNALFRCDHKTQQLGDHAPDPRLALDCQPNRRPKIDRTWKMPGSKSVLYGRSLNANSFQIRSPISEPENCISLCTARF